MKNNQLQRVEMDFSSEAAIKTATALVKSGLLPKAVDTPEKALVIMQKGVEVGFPPMASFEMIFVIDGKPSLMSAAMQTLLHRGGVRYKTIKDAEEKRDKDGKLIDRVTQIVFMRYPFLNKIVHPDGSSETKTDYEMIETMEFRRSDAIKAGLYPGKENSAWNKYPKIMMWHRCFALGASRIAKDLTAGMNSVEEIAFANGMDVKLDNDGNIVDVISVTGSSAPVKKEEVKSKENQNKPKENEL